VEIGGLFSGQDPLALMRTMLNPPKPNKKLTAAMKKFKALDIQREE
jgi:hypothetical protein